MPVGYGGGVASADEARRITGIGIEKVVLNSAAFERPETITEISDALGASSTVVSIDAKKRFDQRLGHVCASWHAQDGYDARGGRCARTAAWCGRDPDLVD